MADLTTCMHSLAPLLPAIEGRSPAGEQTGASRLMNAPAPSTTVTEREAILVSLHEERRRLTRARRLGQASKGDDEYLAELKQYIDEWQAREVAATSNNDDVWARLDALASTLLAAQTEIARQSKK